LLPVGAVLDLVARSGWPRSRVRWPSRAWLPWCLGSAGRAGLLGRAGLRRAAPGRLWSSARWIASE